MIKAQILGARLGLALLGAGMLLSAAPGAAQTGNPALDGPGEALSRNLRSLAENPKSITALMGAGKAALELGDPQAAITFFGRAEEQAPSDGRIKMWIGAALVQLEQPQGALKFFTEATGMGVPEAEVAAQRGMAFDLLGDPRRAQRDYRMALANKPSAEVSRQLALSLAISGEREPALRLLEDQLLTRDRAAERTRAFVLALTGDAAGAARAVQASMPAQSAALAPFLDRLPALSLSERALAVHLGHFPSSARNLPVPRPNTYAAYQPSPTPTRAGAPDRSQAALGTRAVAAPKPQTRVVDRQPAFKSKPVPRAAGRTPIAASPSQIASAAPAAASPTRVTSGASNRETTQDRAERPATKPAASPPRQLAASSPPRAVSSPARQQASAIPVGRVVLPEPQVSSPVVVAKLEPQRQGPDLASTSALPPVQQNSGPSLPLAQAPVQTALNTALPSQALAVPGFSIAATGQSQASAAPQEPVSELASVQAAPKPVSELASVEAPPPASAPVEERGASRLAGIASLIASLPEEPAGAEEAPEPAPVPVKVAIAAPAKKEPPKPVVASKKDLAAKPVVKKDAVEAKKPVAPAEPKRIWVQVAGGADKAALPREFARIKTKAPKLLAARAAWTTPLKATNRLLVGPFKTDGEAQTFVNELKKSNVTGFAWTSEAGQKIEKLSAK
ncbi:MAG TPA: SPOR domain-containing protein [Allosphingosinicella sp.]|jgi:Flp pilus assembly protein TadD